MKRKCDQCGMIRSTKDLVLLDDRGYICFSCWNKFNKRKSRIVNKK